jgi:hypothetical protein
MIVRILTIAAQFLKIQHLNSQITNMCKHTANHFLKCTVTLLNKGRQPSQNPDIVIECKLSHFRCLTGHDIFQPHITTMKFMYHSSPLQHKEFLPPTYSLQEYTATDTKRAFTTTHTATHKATQCYISHFDDTSTMFLSKSTSTDIKKNFLLNSCGHHAATLHLQKCI